MATKSDSRRRTRYQYVICLEELAVQQHYWAGGLIQSWTPDLATASKFNTLDEAADEAWFASLNINAPVCVDRIAVK